ncbi:40S ribosomal protein S4 [Cricetulus griseus]|uniref:40S ribosomal protein S4 n=1 Tax=Cricetulus griseus TaxID=10029 RepID=G3HRV2_CRIGR|nr:40S ribosomal protein S4 [Cricetulus griseus]
MKRKKENDTLHCALMLAAPPWLVRGPKKHTTGCRLQCLPLDVFLRNRLRCAVMEDKMKISKQCVIKVDGKVTTDVAYPAGFTNAITINKSSKNLCLVCDTKGHFIMHHITSKEAKNKLCRMRMVFVGTKGILNVMIHDKHTVHYPNPLIKVNGTVLDLLDTDNIIEVFKFNTDNQR